MHLSDLYLDLLEMTLTGAILEDIGYVPGEQPVLADSYDKDSRMSGRDWPGHAHTMVGLTRLRHLRHLIERVLHDGVPGDLVETGVWRGGVCIYMRAILAAHDITDRRIWAADSFEGLPPGDPDRFPADRDSILHRIAMLAVSLEEVKRNFSQYNLRDDQVVFLKGWFRDTLPQAPIENISILRLDGDMYESTTDALSALYRKVSPGGFVIVDDFVIPGCRQAVQDFRQRHGIDDAIERIDYTGVFWRKTADT